jgi:hypothetical protein
MFPQGSREKTSEPILDKLNFAANAAICNIFFKNAPFSYKEPKGSRDAELKRACG